jgi:uncharacterized protein YjhX (UPF0386 family)
LTGILAALSNPDVELVIRDPVKALPASSLARTALDGWVYPGVDLDLFRRLKRLKAIKSQTGQPYCITDLGSRLVRG